MTTAPKERAAVVKGILLAWAMSGLFIALGVWAQLKLGASPFATYGKAAAFSLIVAALPLVLTIASAARIRLFDQNIDGSDPTPGTALDFTRRIIQNTLEQTALFALAAMAFFFAAPKFSAVLLPVMAIWFCIARILFVIGYKIRPLARTIGFAATFHPTIALLGAALIMAFNCPLA